MRPQKVKPNLSGRIRAATTSSSFGTFGLANNNPDPDSAKTPAQPFFLFLFRCRYYARGGRAEEEEDAGSQFRDTSTE